MVNQRHWGEFDWGDRTAEHTKADFRPTFLALSADLGGKVVLRADYLVERDGVRETHGRIYFEVYEDDERFVAFFRCRDRTQTITIEGRIVPEAGHPYEDHFNEFVDEALAHGLSGIARELDRTGLSKYE